MTEAAPVDSLVFSPAHIDVSQSLCVLKSRLQLASHSHRGFHVNAHTYTYDRDFNAQEQAVMGKVLYVSAP